MTISRGPGAEPGGVAGVAIGRPSAPPSEREARLRALFDEALQLMALLSPDGTVLEVNRAALDAAALTEAQVLGRSFWDAGWWRDDGSERDRIRAAVERASAGNVVREELEVPFADGLVRVLDFSLRPVRAADGSITQLVAEGRDVTESRWAERALRVSEARLAGIIDIASDAIISIDANHTITMFNQGAEAIFGHRTEDVLGQPLDVLLPERFRGGHRGHIEGFAAAPVSARRMGERREILGLRADGTEFPAEASISKLDLFGSMVFTVVLRDISERKRAERAQQFLAQAGTILASSLDYETTLGSLAALTVPALADWSVVYMREDDGTVRRLEVAHADASRRPLLQRLLRYPLDPRRPDPVFTVLDTGEPEVLPVVSDEFVDALATDREHGEVLRSLGMRSMLLVPLVARGETRGAMGFYSEHPDRYGPDELSVAQDLARVAALTVDNARLYRDAQTAIRARDDLISVVSHDLGNPLSAIRIGTSLLLRNVPAEEQGTGGWQHLEFIRQSAEQMERLINDLLDVRRLESGRVALQIRDVKLQEIVREALDIFGPIARERGLELIAELEGAPACVSADYERLSQVLCNLVGNAVKFTDTGAVRIGAHATEDVLLITVADTGRGIPPEHLPHVFDRFWQAQRHGRKGLGLGLAIARGIVEAHGGRIWVESTPGAGSTFLFTLPLVPAH